MDHFILLHYLTSHFSSLHIWIPFLPQLFSHFLIRRTPYSLFFGGEAILNPERALLTVLESFLCKYGVQNYLVVSVKMQIPWPTIDPLHWTLNWGVCFRPRRLQYIPKSEKLQAKYWALISARLGFEFWPHSFILALWAS